MNNWSEKILNFNGDCVVNTDHAIARRYSLCCSAYCDAEFLDTATLAEVNEYNEKRKQVQNEEVRKRVV